MKILNKEEWLSEMPELIHNLKLNYNFYFSGFYTKIKKDILEIVKNPKNKHKISIYNKDNRFWLVVYKKDTSSSRISYFMKKFRKSYEQAEAEYEKNIIEDCRHQRRDFL